MEKFEVDLEIIKCKIHEEDLGEDFINNLENELNNEYNRSCNNNSNRNKSNVVKFPFHFYKTAVAVFACFMVFSTYTFADEIEDMIKAMFCSVSPTSEIAYEEGKLIEVDSEYQKFGDISTKVDYVSVHENEICIALDIKSDIEYDKLNIEDLVIKDDEDNLIYDRKENFYSSKYKINYNEKNASKNNSIIFIEILNNNINFNIISNICLNFNNISTERNEELNSNNGEWTFKINLKQ